MNHRVEVGDVFVLREPSTRMSAAFILIVALGERGHMMMWPYATSDRRVQCIWSNEMSNDDYEYVGNVRATA